MLTRFLLLSTRNECDSCTRPCVGKESTGCCRRAPLHPTHATSLIHAPTASSRWLRGAPLRRLIDPIHCTALAALVTALRRCWLQLSAVQAHARRGIHLRPSVLKFMCARCLGTAHASQAWHAPWQLQKSSSRSTVARRRSAPARVFGLLKVVAAAKCQVRSIQTPFRDLKWSESDSTGRNITRRDDAPSRSAGST